MEKLLDVCSTLFDASQFAKVVKCCDDHLSAKPESAMAWHLKGLAYHKMGDVQKADECFRKAVELDKSEPASYFAIGMLFYGEGKFEEALLLFKICNMIEQKVEHLLMAAMCNLMLKRQEEAELAMRAAFTLDKGKAARFINQFFKTAYEGNKGFAEEDIASLKIQIEKLAK